MVSTTSTPQDQACLGYSTAQKLQGSGVVHFPQITAHRLLRSALRQEAVLGGCQGTNQYHIPGIPRRTPTGQLLQDLPGPPHVHAGQQIWQASSPAFHKIAFYKRFPSHCTSTTTHPKEASTTGRTSPSRTTPRRHYARPERSTARSGRLTKDDSPSTCTIFGTSHPSNKSTSRPEAAPWDIPWSAASKNINGTTHTDPCLPPARSSTSSPKDTSTIASAYYPQRGPALSRGMSFFRRSSTDHQFCSRNKIIQTTSDAALIFNMVKFNSYSHRKRTN